MSSAVVTDQKPSSSGNSVIPSLQCTGHWPRISRKSSCGGPSSQYSRSPTSTSFSFLPTVAIQTSDSPYGLGGDILATWTAARQARRPVHRGPEMDPREMLLFFRSGVGSGHHTPDELEGDLLEGARLLMRERPPWELEPPLEQLARAPFRKLVISGGHSDVFEAVCDRV